MAGLIAIINDDTAFLQLMSSLLSEEGYETLVWRESENAHEVIVREQPALVILDIRLEHPEAGWQLLDLIRLDPKTAAVPVIVCSADSIFLREKAELLRQKRCEVLEKPFDLDDLLDKVQTMLGSVPEGHH